MTTLVGIASVEHYNLAVRALNLFLVGNAELLDAAMKRFTAIARYAEGESFFMALANLAITPPEILAEVADRGSFAVKKRVVQHRSVTVETIEAIIGGVPLGSIREILTKAFVQGHSNPTAKLHTLVNLRGGREVSRLVTLCRPHGRETTSQLKEEFYGRFNIELSTEATIDGVLHHLGMDAPVPGDDFLEDCLKTLIETDGDARAEALVVALSQRGGHKKQLERVAASDLPLASERARDLLLASP